MVTQISRSGASGNYTYSSVVATANNPVINESWFDAIRFVNWLSNGQGSGGTETGSYTLLGGTPTPSNADSIARDPGATWVLPTLDEWYKSAYYQPAAAGGDSDGYWLYATRSNSAPTSASVDANGNITNPGADVVNYDRSFQNPRLTNVGAAGPLSTSHYGTYDQNGNALEWVETLYGSDPTPTIRDSLGGDYFEQAPNIAASYREAQTPTSITGVTGFRIAYVPEPSAILLAAAALAGLVVAGRWCRG